MALTFRHITKVQRTRTQNRFHHGRGVWADTSFPQRLRTPDAHGWTPERSRNEGFRFPSHSMAKRGLTCVPLAWTWREPPAPCWVFSFLLLG